MIILKSFYTTTFKKDAIYKVIKEASPVKTVANNLNIPVSTLYKWVARYKSTNGYQKAAPVLTKKQETHIKQLQLENDILKKALFLPQKKEAIFEFIYENKDNFPVQRLCSLLNVSSSGYYKYIKSIPSKQALKNNQITRLVKNVYIKHGPNIGSPKITKIINDKEPLTSQASVARILKENKEVWHSSFSKFHNNKDVVLHFNNKDTILDSDTDTYFHKELAHEQIDALLNNVHFTNLKMYTHNTSIEVQAFSKNDNLLIHGDNLHALHHLKDSFSKSVQLIYIDVPYRTMRSNLSYYDSFSRSDYLVLLKNRLEIAKTMLKSTGSIFIQCSDEEQAYIKVLCDEIFGDNNFINQIIWQRTTSQQNMSHIATKKEYILVYAKNKKHVTFNRQNSHPNQLEPYKFEDAKGTFRIDKIRDAKNGYYHYALKKPTGHFLESRWVYSHHAVKELISNDLIYWSKNNIPSKKVYLSEDKPKRVVVNDLWVDDSIYGTNREATLELNKLVGPNDFTYPKPEKLLENIIKLATNEGDAVLDFYAGSGTTAASAYKLNRQFILVEKNFDNFNLIIKRMRKTVKNLDTYLNSNNTYITCQIKKTVNHQY